MMVQSSAEIKNVLFGLEAFAISALIVYLIMSKFNLKTLNETFGNGVKALSFTIIVVILGAALTFLQIYITNNYLITENSQSQQMPQQGGGMNGGTNSNVTYTATKTITENASIDGENYTSTTADISVSNASLIAKASEGVVIEGSNSVKLNNCNLTDSNTKLNGQSTTYKNIFLYQSMSGDAKDCNNWILLLKLN